VREPAHSSPKRGKGGKGGRDGRRGLTWSWSPASWPAFDRGLGCGGEGGREGGREGGLRSCLIAIRRGNT